jgi:hypothetical protein
MARRDVLWHRISNPNHRYLRDYGLACGHVLVDRRLVKGGDNRHHVPKHLECPVCAKGKPETAVVFPPNVMRTAAGWALTQRQAMATDAQRRESERVLAPAAPVVLTPPADSPTPDDEGPAKPPRRTSRITVSWSPRDLAARNLEE